MNRALDNAREGVLPDFGKSVPNRRSSTWKGSEVVTCVVGNGTVRRPWAGVEYEREKKKQREKERETGR